MPKVMIDGFEYIPRVAAAPVPPPVYSSVRIESEQLILESARRAMSDSNWAIGQAAAIWTKRYGRGRGDDDFGSLVGIMPDQVYQRRRVWETFGDVRPNFPNLYWSHFSAAITWDDATENLNWARDIGATVAEMKAWRRAQRGEDLSEITESV